MPSDNAELAKLTITKGALPNDTNNILDIDQIILSPISSINLLNNSVFQLGIQEWTGNNPVEAFTANYEGTGNILLSSPNATLIQNVPVNSFSRNSSFLLSFAVLSSTNTGSLRAQVICMDKSGNHVGLPALDLLINAATLARSENYVTYVDVTTPTPKNAVTAQIRFTRNAVGANFNIDKVVFAEVTSSNLLVNPSFESSNLVAPWIATAGTTVGQTDESYEGSRLAQLPSFAGYIYQDVSITPRRCYLLNFGYRPVGFNAAGNLLVEVKWLDRDSRELGLGLSIIILSDTTDIDVEWHTYLGVTEPAPSNAIMARVQFGRSQGGINDSAIEIYKIVLASLV